MSGAVNIHEFLQGGGNVLFDMCFKQNPSKVRGGVVSLLKVHLPHRSWAVACTVRGL